MMEQEAAQQQQEEQQRSRDGQTKRVWSHQSPAAASLCVSVCVRSKHSLTFRARSPSEGRSWLINAATVRLLLQPPDLPLGEGGGLAAEGALQPALVLRLCHDAGCAVVAQCVVAVEKGNTVRVERLDADGALVPTAVTAHTPDTSTAAGLTPASQIQLLWSSCLWVSPIWSPLRVCFVILLFVRQQRLNDGLALVLLPVPRGVENSRISLFCSSQVLFFECNNAFLLGFKDFCLSHPLLNNSL